MLSLMIQSKFSLGSLADAEPRSGSPIEVDCKQLMRIIDQNTDVSARIFRAGRLPKTIVNALKSINLTFNFNPWLPY